MFILSAMVACFTVQYTIESTYVTEVVKYFTLISNGGWIQFYSNLSGNALISQS